MAAHPPLARGGHLVDVTPRVDLPVGEGVAMRPMVFLTGTYDGVPVAPVNNATLLASPSERRRWDAGRDSEWGKAG